MSVSAAIGFIALFGQAVLNGVVMVSYFNELRAQGAGRTTPCSKARWCACGPCAMTSLLAMLGLLPMALSHGIGSEVQRPLATVIIGGLDLGDDADAVPAADPVPCLREPRRSPRFS